MPASSSKSYPNIAILSMCVVATRCHELWLAAALSPKFMLEIKLRLQISDFNSSKYRPLPPMPQHNTCQLCKILGITRYTCGVPSTSKQPSHRDGEKGRHREGSKLRGVVGGVLFRRARARGLPDTDLVKGAKHFVVDEDVKQRTLAVGRYFDRPHMLVRVRHQHPSAPLLCGRAGSSVQLQPAGGRVGRETQVPLSRSVG
mmetsp:Transcript_1975/g.2643  ORF Transcript_1975/g.2643 Transcript_1975/m.2643 type:complete len:201 (-) Transcript_1975:355-957(-)